MKRFGGLLIALTMAAVMLTPTGAQAAQATGEPYLIGIILPMTGTAADYGADFNRGAVLAAEEINAAGGVNGRPIKLVLADSKASPKEGVAEFPKNRRLRSRLSGPLQPPRAGRRQAEVLPPPGESRL